MKKTLFFIVIIIAVVIIGIHIFTSSINVLVTKDDLPQDVYQDDTPFNEAHNALPKCFRMLPLQILIKWESVHGLFVGY